jgi:hypothetical protein
MRSQPLQIVTSDSVCWNLRRVSRMTKGTSTGPCASRKCCPEGLQAVQGGEALAVLLEAADPFLAGRVFRQPGVGRGDQQQAARVQAFVHAIEEFGRAVQAVDQVGGQDQVVAGTGSASGCRRRPGRSRPCRACRPGPGRPGGAFPVGHQFALVHQGVAQHALLGELHAQADEARREVDAGDRRSARASSKLARPAAQPRSSARRAGRSPMAADGQFGQGLGEVGTPKYSSP